MRNRTENAVLQTLMARTEYIRDTLAEGANRQRFSAWQRSVLQPTIERVGLEPKPTDTDDIRDLRPRIFALLGDSGDAATLERARKLVEQVLSNTGSVDAGLANVAFSIVASNGDAALYERIFTAWQNAKSPEQSSRLLFALAQFEDPALVKRNLEFVRSPKMPAQDVIGFMSRLIGNDATRDIAWAFLKEHWKEMREKVVTFGGGGAVGALSGYCDLQHKKDIEDFFKQNRAPGAERTVRQTLERISACVDFKHKQQPEFDKWIANK
jgi:aminopeptidase N